MGRLVRIAKSSVSGDLEDLKTGKIIGRYAFESLKVFVPRDRGLKGVEPVMNGVWRGFLSFS